MNSKIIAFLKNTSYALSSNVLSLIISTLVTLIVPKLLGVEEYGYWQLYQFYIGYVGIFHFGWNDGIYLRYGGERYEELDKTKFFSQFIMAFVLQIFIALIINVYIYFSVSDPNRNYLLIAVSLNLIFTNMQGMLSYILQATNRIREYSVITIINRAVYFVLLTLFLLLGERQFQTIILADLSGCFLSLLVAMYYCKEIVFNKITNFYIDFKEALTNISSGIKLTLAYLASILVIGVVRFGIERNWSVEVFGKVSLTLSISHMMMIFINAVGTVLFPVLRRTNEKQYKNIYLLMRDILMLVSLGLLIIYYPTKTLLSAWLPEYAEALNYMAILFPIFIFEGKMALLFNTFLKTLRKENALLFINLIIVVFSLVLTLISTSLLNNLDLAILSIVILLVFRSILAEFYISRLLNIDIQKDTLLEIALTFVFIVSGWYIDSWLTPIVYGLFYLLYLVLKRKDFLHSFNELYMLSKK